MLKNKFVVLSLIAAGFFAGILINFSPSIETFAQRVIKSTTQFENNWQYAAITRISVENPPPNNLVTFTGAVEINYFFFTYNQIIAKESYVKSERVKHELNYAEFLQERNLRNNQQSQVLASQRAADLALAKAMTKLGSSGWEMTGRSFANFNFETLDASSEYKNSVYFRKHFAQRQTNVNQQ